jgi:hypothetical protein
VGSARNIKNSSAPETDEWGENLENNPMKMWIFKIDRPKPMKRPKQKALLPTKADIQGVLQIVAVQMIENLNNKE